MGLIYLNPQGPMGNPIPKLSALDVRDSFGRMAMNDSETVALIGGGHAFGKTHGACPKGPGSPPNVDPANSWPGECGYGKDKGKGANAFTSGIEGPWTTNPTKWDNSYFQNLLQHKWQVHRGPGGAWQWKVNGTSPVAPAAHGQGTQPIQMMTSDLSLVEDAEYKKIVELFAKDGAAFDNAFKHAWYKLTTRDMGSVRRCVGPDVPPAQPFQYPLPEAPKHLANFEEVAAAVEKIIDSAQTTSADFLRLAFQCASTFRVTDKQGGCDGARIRFSPQADWAVNKGLDAVLAQLLKIKRDFGSGLSYADLIVLAGTVAVEKLSGKEMSFAERELTPPTVLVPST